MNRFLIRPCRNNLLGYSLSKIMKANGNQIVKTNIVNDRGIHICKSMLAWRNEMGYRVYRKEG